MSKYCIAAYKIKCVDKRGIVCLSSDTESDDRRDEQIIKLEKKADSFSSKILQAINDEKVIIGEYYAFVKQIDDNDEKDDYIKIVACLYKYFRGYDGRLHYNSTPILIEWSDNCVIK